MKVFYSRYSGIMVQLISVAVKLYMPVKVVKHGARKIYAPSGY